MARYRKIYKTRSNEARIPLQLGDVTVDAHFVNGNIRDNQWATLETSDSLVQFVIENSPLFRKRIFLDTVIPIVDESAKDYKLDEITNKDELREMLMNKFGYDLSKVSAPNSLKARVKELGLALPNMVW